MRISESANSFVHEVSFLKKHHPLLSGIFKMSPQGARHVIFYDFNKNHDLAHLNVEISFQKSRKYERLSSGRMKDMKSSSRKREIIKRASRIASRLPLNTNQGVR